MQSLVGSSFERLPESEIEAEFIMGLIDTSTHALSKALDPLLEHLSCKVCEKCLRDKIKDVRVRWTAVKVIQTCFLLSFSLN